MASPASCASWIPLLDSGIAWSAIVYDTASHSFQLTEVKPCTNLSEHLLLIHRDEPLQSNESCNRKRRCGLQERFWCWNLNHPIVSVVREPRNQIPCDTECWVLETTNQLQIQYFNLLLKLLALVLSSVFEVGWRSSAEANKNVFLEHLFQGTIKYCLTCVLPERWKGCLDLYSLNVNKL